MTSSNSKHRSLDQICNINNNSLEPVNSLLSCPPPTLLNNEHKFIKISSIGQVEIEPDIVEFCIKITTNKTTASLAKESVKKRKDFITSALNKFKIPVENVKSSTIVRRVPAIIEDKVVIEEENSHNQDNQTKEENLKRQLAYFEELCVTCSSLYQYLKVFSICEEKLDHHVKVSRPVVRFSPSSVQECTQKAIRQAMSNGIKKANDIISSTNPNVKLGRLYCSEENSLKVETLQDYQNNEIFETFRWKRLNKVVKCSLTSVFELEYKKTRILI